MRAATILSVLAAPAYAGGHGDKVCRSKTEAETMTDLRTSLNCSAAAPTTCACLGATTKLTPGQTRFACPGPDVTLWNSTGKMCINATSDKDSTWARHDWPYPDNTAATCDGSSGTGPNWEPGSYDCTKVKITPVTDPVTYKTHKFEKGFAGYNAEYNSEAWCTGKSCYVDPCTCNMKDFSASSWFKKADGSKLYYSGMMCGAAYTFKDAVCTGKTTKTTCEADSGCTFASPVVADVTSPGPKKTVTSSGKGAAIGVVMVGLVASRF